MKDLEIGDSARILIYRHFLDTGRALSADELAEHLGGDRTGAESLLLSLAEAHTIVLAPGARSIWMAHPFSATPTLYRVRSGGVSYWANCAWDALGIAAILGRDTECLAHCPDCLEPVDLSVRNGAPAGSGLVHFAVPPRRFWENVAFT